MASVKYWLWLTTRRGLGQRGALRLLDHFGTPERAYYADPEEYAQVEDLSPQARMSLEQKDTGQAEAILAACDRLGADIMTMQDAAYPERLRQIADPPVVLYIKGRMPAFDEEAAIGVVGSRKLTPYGEKMASQLGLELARGGALVVSGIAEGSDALALRGALKGGGTVVSVLGGGVDVPFPPENRYLYQDVAAAGALISEYPPGIRPIGAHFPRRNRILTGLCLGVVAVEGTLKSGTMSSMNHALEQDRDLFAVPGNVDAPNSQGPNWLIQQGAKLVTCGRDILEEYWDRYPLKLAASAPLTPEAARERLDSLSRERLEREQPQQPPRQEPPSPKREAVPLSRQKSRYTDDQLAILRAMGDKSRTPDELVELTQIPARRVLSALTMLQLDGSVEEGQGRRFSARVELE